MPVLSALSCSNPTLVFGLFLLLFYFVLMCFAYMHVCVHERLMFIETKKKGITSPAIGITDGCGLPFVFDLNLGSSSRTANALNPLSQPR